MYKSNYDITPPIQDPIEKKIERDQLQFPNALPANSHHGFHQQDFTFIDRQFQNDRKNNNRLPVQNSYLQQYQIHELQQQNFGYNAVAQTQVDRIMEKKIPSDARQLDRNRDDAMLFGRQNPVIIPPQFMPTPQDTRKEKYELNSERTPMSKVLGAPAKYSSI